MNGSFSVPLLLQKLSELNNSSISIQFVSHWCIFHQRNARVIVEIWMKLFQSFPKEKHVPFMYLANDILQNSKRKGNEYVNEFWKILPSAVKSVSNSGDDYTMDIVRRLVDIWEQRKIFGSHSHLLKDELFAKTSPSKVENNESSQFYKILEKDATSLRIKLAIGCWPEKIISTFQSVNDELFNEEMVLDKCKSASRHILQIEKAVDVSCAEGNTQRLPSTNELEAEEAVLGDCIEKLVKIEATRASLISHLKEALQKQESELESIHTQLNVAKAESKHASTLKKKILLGSSRCTNSLPAILTAHPSEETNIVDSYFPNIPNYSTQQSIQPAFLFSNSLTAEEQHKKTAADLAAKLSAMSSPAEVLSSVLSSFVGQQASSGTAGLESMSFPTSGPSIFPMAKKPRLEKPLPISYAAAPSVIPHQQLPNVPSQCAIVSSKPMSKPPFLPPLTTTSLWQHTQTTGGMPTVSYEHNGRSTTIPPHQPLPPPANSVMGSSRSITSCQLAPQQHGLMLTCRHRPQCFIFHNS